MDQLTSQRPRQNRAATNPPKLETSPVRPIEGEQSSTSVDRSRMRQVRTKLTADDSPYRDKGRDEDLRSDLLEEEVALFGAHEVK